MSVAGVLWGMIWGGSQRVFLTRVETIKFRIVIIRQIVYITVTFPLIISSFSSAHIVSLKYPKVKLAELIL